MKFSAEPIDLAAGGLLAHGVKGDGFSFKKGRVLSGADVALLAAKGFTNLVVARLQPDDVGEDVAAAQLAAALAGSGVKPAPAATGRANLHATARGLLQIDAARVDRANGIDEAITVATLPIASVVRPGQMLATVKLIPFAVPQAVLGQCLEVLRAAAPVLSVAAFQPHRAGLVQTRLPGLKDGLLEKMRQVTQGRLAALGSELDDAVVVAHDERAVAAAVAAQRERGLDPILIGGASAIVDRRDIVPAAIIACGGEIVHFGMPVDPGNLLLLGRLDGAAVIGLPGCARSAQLNGFDMVLQRLLAGLPLGPADIMGWGVGGLLAEIPQRPQPRQLLQPAAPPTTSPDLNIAAIVLAAGKGTRMGGDGKLLVDFAGQPLLRAAVDAAKASHARSVLVVTGHRGEEVRAAIADANVDFIDNPAYADGLAGSLAAGVLALPEEIDGALVLLGDMPRVSAYHIDALIAAFATAPPGSICVPVHAGRRGNPVLWPAALFSELAAQKGDIGGRELLGRHAERLRMVEMPDDAVLIDIDEPHDLTALTADISS